MPKCGIVDQGHRPARAIFLCRECGHFDHADLVGATNIAAAAKVAWRKVSERQPNSKGLVSSVQGQAPEFIRGAGDTLSYTFDSIF